MNLSKSETAAPVETTEEAAPIHGVEKAIESIIDQIPAEVLAALPQVPEKAGELFAALVELPAAIDTLSRCTLAKSFIGRDAAGQFEFDAPAFENAWAYLNGAADEADPETT